MLAKTPRPERLGDLEIKVVCESSQEFDVGYNDGRPMAFYMLDTGEPDPAIAGFVWNGDSSSEIERLSPPSIVGTKSLDFTLTSPDFSARYEQDVLNESFRYSHVLIEVFVWIDGGWRVQRNLLEPLEASAETEPYTKPYTKNPPFMLDGFYERRMSQLQKSTPETPANRH